jgi:ribosome-associated protein
MQEIAIRDAVIRLGQFLKLANAIESGADAKRVLETDDVTVNGLVEHRRGRQLVKGDEVGFADETYRVV